MVPIRTPQTEPVQLTGHAHRTLPVARRTDRRQDIARRSRLPLARRTRVRVDGARAVVKAHVLLAADTHGAALASQSPPIVGAQVHSVGGDLDTAASLRRGTHTQMCSGAHSGLVSQQTRDVARVERRAAVVEQLRQILQHGEAVVRRKAAQTDAQRNLGPAPHGAAGWAHLAGGAGGMTTKRTMTLPGVSDCTTTCARRHAPRQRPGGLTRPHVRMAPARRRRSGRRAQCPWRARR
jgi:hypothetical protein